jgi:high-affinity nickel-transport protein
MAAVVVALHVVGFGIFIFFVLPSHYQGLGIGVSVLAYTLGLRHAFDADHIAAIDNTVRKLLHDRSEVDAPRPLKVGYYFSLGHSTVVIAVGCAIVVAEKTVFPTITRTGSGLHVVGGVIGTVASASFLYLIALMNIVILSNIWKMVASMKRGDFDEGSLEAELQNRGLMNRFFGKWMRSISHERQMYPVGVVFGLGFDTATEVALLATTALLAAKALPWYALVCLPILFTAGMTLMDSIDGVLMNMAYGWAFFNPVRKVFYNLSITTLSVTICVFIASVELLSLLPSELHLHGRFWSAVAHFNLNTAGIVIVGLFVLTWASALTIWRAFGIEQKWGSRLGSPSAPPS